MTTASGLITAAYRESNLISLVATPTTNEQTEALNRLNPLVLSTIGSEAGNELTDIQIGGTYDQSSSVTTFIPANSRLALNLSAATTYKLNPLPLDGERVAIADAAANLNTNNLTLSGNGRRIETAASVTLNTASLSRQWMYRADLGNWVRLTDLALSDAMPFPEEYDDYFIVSLALRLNPRHSASLAPESQAALERSKQQLQARYRTPRPTQDWGSLGLMGQSSSSLGGAVFNPLR